MVYFIYQYVTNLIPRFPIIRRSSVFVNVGIWVHGTPPQLDFLMWKNLLL